MNRTVELNRPLISFGIPFLAILFLVLLSKSSIFLANSDVFSLAISLDLLLVVPIIYYILIRKTEISKTTVIAVMVIGLLIGSYFLPEEKQTYLKLFKTWALPIIEVSILTYVIIKVRSAIAKYKNLTDKSPDFFTTLKNISNEILPKKLVMPFATEIAVLYYGFMNWRNPKLKENEFTYHKNSGTIALLGAFILIIGGETIAFHFLLALWSTTAAWILTILSIYTAIQVFGFAKSLSKRPSSINQDILSLKYGILNEVEISFTDIDNIELSKKPLDEKDVLTKSLSPLGELESHNLIIHLNKENQLIGLYGIRKKFTVLAFHIDNSEEFKSQLDNALQGKKNQSEN